jgi:bisphosphoglycerate-independent phosphoglycerate mutase (AlkP superfamily)
MGIGIHTTNPVPLLVVGPGAGAFREAQAITDVAGGIMAVLRGDQTSEVSKVSQSNSS